MLMMLGVWNLEFELLLLIDYELVGLVVLLSRFWMVWLNFWCVSCRRMRGLVFLGMGVLFIIMVVLFELFGVVFVLFGIWFDLLLFFGVGVFVLFEFFGVFGGGVEIELLYVVSVGVRYSVNVRFECCKVEDFMVVFICGFMVFILIFEGG